jgi:hypothetical protein
MKNKIGVKAMMEQLLKRIDELDDRKAIRALEFYSARVFKGMKTSPEEMLDGIPAEFKDRAPFDSVLKMSAQESARPLPEAESAVIARELLYVFARDLAFSPSLEETLDEYASQDNTLLAAEILAIGVAISMIIVASTTTFKGSIGNFEVTKETADASLIEALLKHFPKLG